MRDQVKVCPTCGAEYRDSLSYCVVDGSPLKSQDAGEVERSSDAGRVRLPKETIVGLVAVGAIILIILTFVSVRRSTQFRLHVVFQEGYKLKEGDKVFVDGYEAGYIVSFRPDKPNYRFIATITVRPEVAELLTSECYVTAHYGNVLTGKSCIVILSDQDGIPLKHGSSVTGYGKGVVPPKWRKKWRDLIKKLPWLTSLLPVRRQNGTKSQVAHRWRSVRLRLHQAHNDCLHGPRQPSIGIVEIDA